MLLKEKRMLFIIKYYALWRLCFHGPLFGKHSILYILNIDFQQDLGMHESW